MVIFVNRQIELVMKTLVSLLCCTALTVGSASAQSYRVEPHLENGMNEPELRFHLKHYNIFFRKKNSVFSFFRT